MKLVSNPPLGVDVSVATGVPSNSIVTGELGSNPAPTMFTDVPVGPEVGSRKMIGLTIEVTVNVFEAELDP